MNNADNQPARSPAPAGDESVVQALLQYEASLRNGRLGDTQVIGNDPVFQRKVQLGQFAMQELEAAMPRRPAAIPSWAPRQIGRFRIRSVLGSGGFAVVYLAFDPSLNRCVALKIPRPHVLAVRDHQRRFVTEARATAMLDHPNIVPVYEAGEDGDLPYIVCAWCEGPTLWKWLQDQPRRTPPHVAAKIVGRLARAVQFSHDRGILHRDIKPGNVLLFPQSGTPDPEFPFIPRLADFGLAKLTESGQLDSMTSQLIGTPQYMAPELLQATGSHATPASDIYSLGAVLYCLLIGRPPFDSASTMEALRLIVERDAVMPHIIHPGIGRDLSLICMKCLEKSPQRRYLTASALQQDLHRYLTGQPVRARQTPVWIRLQKWCSQRPAVASLLAATVCLTAVMVLLAARYTASLRDLQLELRFRNTELKNRIAQLGTAVETANRHKTDSETHRRTAEELVFVTDLQLADALHQAGDIRGTLSVLSRYEQPSASLQTMFGPDSFAWRYLRSRSMMPGAVLSDAGQTLWDMRVSGDGTQLALCGSRGRVRLLNIADKCQTLLEQSIATTELNNIAWCDSQPLLATSGDDGVVRICNSQSLQLLRSLPMIPGNHAYGIAFLPGSTRLLASGWSRDVHLTDAGTGEILQTVTSPHDRVVECLEVSADGKFFATGGEEGSVCLWNTADLSVVWTMQFPQIDFPGPVSHIRFSGDTKSLVVCSNKKLLRVLETATGTQQREWRSLDKLTALSMQGQRIICGDQAGLLSEFTLDSAEADWTPLRRWRGHQDQISSIAYVRPDPEDPARLDCVSSDRASGLRVWSAMSPGQGAVQQTGTAGLPDKLMSVCWTKDSTLLRCEQHAVRSADPLSGVISDIYSSDTPLAGCHYVAADDRLLVTTADGELIILSDERKSETRMVVFRDEPIDQLSVDTAGTRALVRGAETNVVVVDLQKSAVVGRLWDREASLVSPDGRWVVSGSRERDVFEVFDAVTMEFHTSLPSFDPTYSSATFTKDSRQLIATNNDRTVAIWDTATWDLVHRFVSKGLSMGPIAVHPDGRTLAAASERELVLWDLPTGRPLVHLGTFPGDVHGLSFSTDGSALAFCSGDLHSGVITTAEVGLLPPTRHPETSKLLKP